MRQQLFIILTFNINNQNTLTNQKKKKENHCNPLALLDRLLIPLPIINKNVLVLVRKKTFFLVKKKAVEQIVTFNSFMTNYDNLFTHFLNEYKRKST